MKGVVPPHRKGHRKNGPRIRNHGSKLPLRAKFHENRKRDRSNWCVSWRHFKNIPGSLEFTRLEKYVSRFPEKKNKTLGNCTPYMGEILVFLTV